MTAKLFKNGESQAVRLPKECRFSGTEVSVVKIGELVILMPQGSGKHAFLQSLDYFTEDFMIERMPDRFQERESL